CFGRVGGSGRFEGFGGFGGFGRVGGSGRFEGFRQVRWLRRVPGNFRGAGNGPGGSWTPLYI
ncbi:hypothetical protein ACIPSJ_04975, partial [Streptomyces sp. NPDC090088]|uniref:hypothetical protein n=1 Tax=Streptomyces sp. NPDC090088 TaxID=3365944 RepID=UPI003829F1C1